MILTIESDLRRRYSLTVARKRRSPEYKEILRSIRTARSLGFKPVPMSLRLGSEELATNVLKELDIDHPQTQEQSREQYKHGD